MLDVELKRCRQRRAGLREGRGDRSLADLADRGDLLVRAVSEVAQKDDQPSSGRQRSQSVYETWIVSMHNQVRLRLVLESRRLPLTTPRLLNRNPVRDPPDPRTERTLSPELR